MPKLAKKKFNPTVRNTPTFKKKWIKPGKKLRRENTTNTQFQAKKITLIEQISLKDDNDDDEPQQQKTTTVGNDKNDGLLAQRNVKNLAELAPQLGHYNENLCRDAILGVRSHFFHSPEIVRKQLRLIIPGVGALLIRELKQTATRNQLKRLLEQLCELPTDLMQSHFQLFSQFVLTAISDLRPVVRTLGVDVLFMLLKKYPELCAKSEEIFNKYLQLFGQQRSATQTADYKLKMLDSIHQFILAYRPSPKSASLWQCQELDFNFSEQPSPSIQLLPTPNVFHFPIFNAEKASAVQSPMEKADGLMNCCQTLCSFLVATIREEELGMTKCKLNAVITRVFNAVSSLADAVLTFFEMGAENDDNQLNEQQFRASLAKAFTPLKKCPAIEGSKKLMEKLEMIGAAKR